MRKKEQIKRNQWRSPNQALLGLLVFSIVIAVTIVACTKESPITPTDDTVLTPDFGGDESTSAITTLFTSVAKGAAGDVGEMGMSWALSALGLADGSPDYTAQFEKIEEDLNVIIEELNEVLAELSEIENTLNAINCSEWQSSQGANTPIARIHNLMTLYKTMTNTAATGGRVSNATLADWADQVLAHGSYSSHTPMGELLSSLAQTVYTPPSGGVIYACLPTISTPGNGTFGSDTTYYNSVKLYIDYYFNMQLQGVALLNEALHYKAWVAVGSPTSDSLSADSTALICQDPDAMLLCNETAAYVNNLYNNLIEQLTKGGAPYTDENFVLEYSAGSPYIWPFSLEDFTTAAGDNCADPLTSAKPCGITANKYNNENMKSVTFKGYTGWLIASNDIHLTHLLAGWTSGTVGDYLEDSLGFKNMKNKIVVGEHTVSIEISSAGEKSNYISFFDTDINKSHGMNQPTVSTGDYNKLAHKSGKNHVNNNECGYYYNYSEGSGLPSSRNNFYNLKAVSWWTDVYGTAEHCRYLSWSTEPGWLASNSATKQYRWPIGSLKNFTCTESRSNKNAGGVWTMCGDDFTAWFDFYVPRPETCDNAGAGVTCNLSGETINKAKRIFNNTDNNTVNNPL